MQSELRGQIEAALQQQLAKLTPEQLAEQMEAIKQSMAGDKPQSKQQGAPKKPSKKGKKRPATKRP